MRNDERVLEVLGEQAINYKRLVTNNFTLNRMRNETFRQLRAEMRKQKVGKIFVDNYEIRDTGSLIFIHN